MDVADILEKAADLLEPEGAWTRGEYGGSGYCHCVNGAILRAEGTLGEGNYDDANSDGCRAFAQAMGFRHPWDNINWNDAPERTQAEVVAALREAAAKARAA